MQFPRDSEQLMSAHALSACTAAFGCHMREKDCHNFASDADFANGDYLQMKFCRYSKKNSATSNPTTTTKVLSPTSHEAALN